MPFAARRLRPAQLGPKNRVPHGSTEEGRENVTKPECHKAAEQAAGAYGAPSVAPLGTALRSAQPEPDAEQEAIWRARLAPNFAELGVDASALPTGPGRLPFSDEAADVLEEFRPAVVSFHFGLSSEALLSWVRRWSAKSLSSATTVDEARWLQARLVDAVIAQGIVPAAELTRQLAGALPGAR
ncbi:hypothetical protein WME79_31925 [Sorangium sp. So ce726]